MGKPIVFISCGQRTPEERKLGEKICRLVEELTPFTPYFADNQTTVEGLTTNIFKALYHSAGFVAVLHKRGVVSYEQDGKPALTRASVFVEQEIALAAFMTQALGRPLQVAAFIDPEIALEGVREHILLNPRQFEGDSEILDRLRQILPTWTASTDTTSELPPLGLELRITPDVAYNAPQQLTEHKLSIILGNRSDRIVSKYRVEVVIPKGAVEVPWNSVSWVRERSQKESDFFRFTESHRREPIYPGDSPEVWSINFATRKIPPGQVARAMLFVEGSPGVQVETISLG